MKLAILHIANDELGYPDIQDLILIEDEKEAERIARQLVADNGGNFVNFNQIDYFCWDNKDRKHSVRITSDMTNINLEDDPRDN